MFIEITNEIIKAREKVRHYEKLQAMLKNANHKIPMLNYELTLNSYFLHKIILKYKYDKFIHIRSLELMNFHILQ